jgi:hypothetical protein
MNRKQKRSQNPPTPRVVKLASPPIATAPDQPHRLDWLARQLMPIVGQLLGAQVDPSVYDWETLGPEAKAVNRRFAEQVYAAVLVGNDDIRITFEFAAARQKRLLAEKLGFHSQEFQAAFDAEEKAYAAYARKWAENEAAEKQRKRP